MHDRTVPSVFYEMKPCLVRFVMIIESDADLACALQEILHDQNISIMLATTGREALQATKLLTPLLFVINQHLSDGDGITLYDRLSRRRHLFHVPTLILSTNIDRCWHLLEERGIIGLELPADLDDLVSAVRSLLPAQMI